MWIRTRTGGLVNSQYIIGIEYNAKLDETVAIISTAPRKELILCDGDQIDIIAGAIKMNANYMGVRE